MKAQIDELKKQLDELKSKIEKLKQPERWQDKLVQPEKDKYYYITAVMCLFSFSFFVRGQLNH